MLLTAAAASAAPTDAQPSDLVDVASATCARFLKAISYAKPPANPAEKQAPFAVLAQDDLVLAMTWVNGYRSGRDGAKGTHGFNQRWQDEEEAQKKGRRTAIIVGAQ